MGDFTGFSFGGWSSTDPLHGVVKVLRVSGGDRYNETLHPEIKDRTAEVPGVNGEYYFGSDYGTRTFDIDIAFDSLTEEQFKELRKTFGTKDIKKLIFDERPYKYYMAKLESPIELSYVCFEGFTREPFSQSNFSQDLPDGVRMITDNEDNRIREKIDPWVYSEKKTRIYKGEGTISFICYFPFAKSTFKQLPIGQESADWASSSGILSATEYQEYDEYNSQTGRIKVYNAGDIETGFRLYLPKAVVTSNAITITYLNHNYDVLQLEQMTINNNDIGVLIDTNNQLIIGVSNMEQTQDSNWTYTTSGNLYNRYISSGHFFHLQTNIPSSSDTIEITNGGNGIKIFYDYLYF